LSRIGGTRPQATDPLGWGAAGTGWLLPFEATIEPVAPVGALAHAGARMVQQTGGEQLLKRWSLAPGAHLPDGAVGSQQPFAALKGWRSPGRQGQDKRLRRP